MQNAPAGFPARAEKIPFEFAYQRLFFMLSMSP